MPQAKIVLIIFSGGMYVGKNSFQATKMPMEQNKREQFIIRWSGGTTYKAKVVSNESGGNNYRNSFVSLQYCTPCVWRVFSLNPLQNRKKRGII